MKPRKKMKQAEGHAERENNNQRELLMKGQTERVTPRHTLAGKSKTTTVNFTEPLLNH